MQVKGAQTRHLPNLLGQHPEGHHNKHIGIQGAQLLQEIGALQRDGLQQRQVVLHGELLHGALVHLEAAAAWLVGHGDHSGNLVLAFQQRLERAHCKLWRTHINHPDDAVVLFEEAESLVQQLVDILEQSLEPELDGIEVEGLLANGGP